jgi:hypothetical protein
METTHHEWWIEMVLPATMYTVEVTVHVHLLEGHFLVQFQSIGRLPPRLRSSKVLERLFKDDNLLTYPSSMPEMDYMLAMPISGHQVHMGFRDKELIVRACIGNSVLEFIPSAVFGSPQYFDLPASLMESCTHVSYFHFRLATFFP